MRFLNLAQYHPELPVSDIFGMLQGMQENRKGKTTPFNLNDLDQ